MRIDETAGVDSIALVLDNAEVLNFVNHPPGEWVDEQLYFCCHPQCPGWPWKASEHRHPCADAEVNG